jgi:hypothetical protein
MSKEKSFWERLFGSTSCCASREKDRAYRDEEERREGKENDKNKDKVRKEDEEQPGSIFTEIDLREDSVYATGVYDQEYIDGSVEIR